MFDQVAHNNDSYFRKVLGNMVRCRRRTGDDQQFIFVRAGTTGNGTSPNYQVENSEGKIIACYSGLNHEEMDGPFEPEHLTRQYTYEEVQQFIAERS